MTTPDNPVTVKFYIKNKVYTVGNVVFPKGDSQLVWCNRHTPNTEQTVNIKVTATGGASVSNANISAKIVDLLHFDIENFSEKKISTKRYVQCRNCQTIQINQNLIVNSEKS